MSRFYTFNFNGSVEVMTLFEASQRTEPEIISRVAQIKESNANKKRVKDGFEPGWQENIQQHCGDRRQYNQALKEKGLVEIGKDYVPADSTVSGTYCRSEEFVEAIIEQGVELSGNEVEAIKSGEYFED